MVVLLPPGWGSLLPSIGQVCRDRTWILLPGSRVASSHIERQLRACHGVMVEMLNVGLSTGYPVSCPAHAKAGYAQVQCPTGAAAYGTGIIDHLLLIESALSLEISCVHSSCHCLAPEDSMGLKVNLSGLPMSKASPEQMRFSGSQPERRS